MFGVKLEFGKDRIAFVGKKNVYKIPNFLDLICNQKSDGSIKWRIKFKDLFKKSLIKHVYVRLQYGRYINKIETETAELYPHNVVQTKSVLYGLLNIQPKLKKVDIYDPNWDGYKPFYVYQKLFIPRGFDFILQDFEKQKDIPGIGTLGHVFLQSAID